MAITVNDDFVAGQTLTNTECNNFPRGLVAITKNDTSDASITAEEVQMMVSWTAVANRNYRFIYTEPQLTGTTATTCTVRLRSGTDTTGTVLNSSTVGITSTLLPFISLCQSVGNYGVGAQSVVATLQFSAGTGSATRSATRLAILTVEDLGTA